MPRFDERSAQVTVFTFKEGLLSAVAHDLKIAVTKFHVETEERADAIRVLAALDSTSLRVSSAMKKGVEAPSLLPRSGPAEIEKNIRETVLESVRYPEIRFEATHVTPTEVVGKLSLHGVTREIRGARRDAKGWIVAEFRLDQRDFGITPFKAMLGALKVKPDLVVEIRLPSSPA